MNKGTVKYSKEFINNVGLREWLSIELPIGEKIESEVIRQSFEDAQNAVMEFHKQSNQGMIDNSIAPAPPTIIQVKQEDREIGVSVESIMSCVDLKTLDTYKLLVKGKPELQQAFNRRENQLIQLMCKD